MDTRCCSKDSKTRRRKFVYTIRPMVFCYLGCCCILSGRAFSSSPAASVFCKLESSASNNVRRRSVLLRSSGGVRRNDRYCAYRGHSIVMCGCGGKLRNRGFLRGAWALFSSGSNDDFDNSSFWGDADDGEGESNNSNTKSILLFCLSVSSCSCFSSTWLTMRCCYQAQGVVCSLDRRNAREDVNSVLAVVSSPRFFCPTYKTT